MRYPFGRYNLFMLSTPYIHINLKLEDIILSKRADVFYTKQCRVVRHHDTPLLFKALFEYEQGIPTECILI